MKRKDQKKALQTIERLIFEDIQWWGMEIQQRHGTTDPIELANIKDFAKHICEDMNALKYIERRKEDV